MLLLRLTPSIRFSQWRDSVGAEQDAVLLRCGSNRPACSVASEKTKQTSAHSGLFLTWVTRTTQKLQKTEQSGWKATRCFSLLCTTNTSMFVSGIVVAGVCVVHCTGAPKNNMVRVTVFFGVYCACSTAYCCVA